MFSIGVLSSYFNTEQQCLSTAAKKQNISLPSCDYVVSKKECYLVSFYYHVDDDQACLLIWRFFLDLVLFP